MNWKCANTAPKTSYSAGGVDFGSVLTVAKS